MATIDNKDLVTRVRTAAATVALATRPPLQRWARRCADLLIPPVCLGCRTPLEEHDNLCARCWLTIDFIRPPLCDRLGIPLPFGLQPPFISARAAAEPPDYDRARAVASHAGLMRDLAHGLKYGDQHHVVSFLARLLQTAGAELLAGSAMLIPIPLARGRLRKRTFNQAAVLATALSRLCRVPTDPLILERIKETPSQVGLSREERQNNLSGAFRIAEGGKERLRGRHVILIDDVITTGATINAAARTLKRAGIARVDALALTLVTGDEDRWRPD